LPDAIFCNEGREISVRVVAMVRCCAVDENDCCDAILAGVSSARSHYGGIVGQNVYFATYLFFL
jgi:hypothetical protein